MGGAKRIEFAFAALGESVEPARLANGADFVPPPGQNLMRIGLMADIPNKTVVGRIENVMQGDGQLDHAETGAKMAAGFRNRVNRLRAQLAAKQFNLFGRQLFEILRRVHTIQQRCVRHALHPLLLARKTFSIFIFRDSAQVTNYTNS